MKKFGAIIVIFFFSLNVYAETTSFGFNVDFPTHYKIYKNVNLVDLLKRYQGNKLDKNFAEKEFKDLGLKTNKITIDFLLSKRFDAKFNNINISVDKNSDPLNLQQLRNPEIRMMCLYMKDFYQKAYKQPNLKQHSCSVSKQLNVLSFKMVHDGPQSNLNDRLIQFLIENRRYGLITFTLGCEIKNCYQMESDLIKIANSVR